MVDLSFCQQRFLVIRLVKVTEKRRSEEIQVLARQEMNKFEPVKTRSGMKGMARGRVRGARPQELLNGLCLQRGESAAHRSSS